MSSRRRCPRLERRRRGPSRSLDTENTYNTVTLLSSDLGQKLKAMGVKRKKQIWVDGYPVEFTADAVVRLHCEMTLNEAKAYFQTAEGKRQLAEFEGVWNEDRPHIEFTTETRGVDQ